MYHQREVGDMEEVSHRIVGEMLTRSKVLDFVAEIVGLPAEHLGEVVEPEGRREKLGGQFADSSFARGVERVM